VFGLLGVIDSALETTEENMTDEFWGSGDGVIRADFVVGGLEGREVMAESF
jgi:hypothetical protein